MSNSKMVIAGCMYLCLAPAVLAQTTAPAPQPPVTDSASDLLVNPTIAECDKGWTAEMTKWTKERFDQLCTLMKSAK